MSELSSADLTKAAIAALAQRGVTLPEIADLVVDLQRPYYPALTTEMALVHVERVLVKHEVSHAVLTGIAIDQAAEAGLLSEPIRSVLMSDEGTYGCDEILALSITNVYGSIGLTNFGYLDKTKPGVIARLNDRKGQAQCDCFLDDLVAAIAAAAASRLAHQWREQGPPPATPPAAL